MGLGGRRPNLGQGQGLLIVRGGGAPASWWGTMQNGTSPSSHRARASWTSTFYRRRLQYGLHHQQTVVWGRRGSATWVALDCPSQGGDIPAGT